ncbi:MAG: BamA/TamA family outer membrane protein [Bacteroidales bacterium]|jgi:hypothetical protein|nr:BamA/TamA family outer membrane protein [Bacteroidales bacterium]
MKKIAFFLFFVLSFVRFAQSQNIDTAQSKVKNEIVKKGFSLGPLPIVAFDQDKGLQYGALLNVFDFGDGSYYPNPRQQWYVEYSAFTKGSQQFFLTYDTRNLIPNVRMSLAATVMLDQAMDFYGYNGYQAIYHADSMTAFYRLNRQALSLKADFVGKLPKKNWFWQGSYLMSNYRYRPIDKAVINKGKPENEQFLGETLYEKYMDWGIIPNDEKKGGFVSAPRGGLMYDSRDFEPAPSRGIWAEVNLTLAPKFLGTTHQFSRYMLIWRHYIPIPNEQLVFAYRVNYQGTLGNYLPYYMMPVFNTIGREWERDGLGGYRTVRGVMRDRVQALDVAFFNAELRWRFMRFTVAKQNVYLALNAFIDGGMATRYYDFLSQYEINGVIQPPATWTSDIWQNIDIERSYDALHMATGGGFRIVINQNFIIAVDYAKPFNKQDGNGGLYVNTGYLF